jgi:hypothetical protein
MIKSVSGANGFVSKADMKMAFGLSLGFAIVP